MIGSCPKYNKFSVQDDPAYEIILTMTNFITKTCLYNVDHIKPHFYIVKPGFTGVYIIVLISAQKHTVCVLVRTASLK